jgi:ribonuclease G
VLKTLRKSLDEDRTKTFVVEISPLGLVEMTRQNVTEGVREIMTRPCPTCGGDGVIESEETIALDFSRRLRTLAREHKAEALLVQMNPRVSSQFTTDGAWLLKSLEEETGKSFLFEGSGGLPLDHFAITFEGKREEVEERAIPFRVGDEVNVDIVEPHMYDVDAAVAKIDGYIISVLKGGPHVGERRLVRIEEVGRTGATARLVGGGSGGGESPETEPSEGDEVESKPRRRGRRGGRRRSRAKAASES